MSSTNSKHYIVGTYKPEVEIHIQPHDKFYWDRRRAANKLDRDEETLNDEPDFDTRMDVDRE